MLWIFLFFISFSSLGLEVNIDGRLKPYMDDFLKLFDEYDIEYNEMLIAVKKVAVLDTLRTSPTSSTLGLLKRCKSKKLILATRYTSRVYYIQNFPTIICTHQGKRVGSTIPEFTI